MHHLLPPPQGGCLRACVIVVRVIGLQSSASGGLHRDGDDVPRFSLVFGGLMQFATSCNGVS